MVISEGTDVHRTRHVQGEPCAGNDQSGVLTGDPLAQVGEELAAVCG